MNQAEMNQAVLVLSVLTLAVKQPGKTHGLWDGQAKRYVYTGTEDECYEVKDRMESIEQGSMNREWVARSKASQIEMQVKAGVPEEDAVRMVNENFALS